MLKSKGEQVFHLSLLLQRQRQGSQGQLLAQIEIPQKLNTHFETFELLPSLVPHLLHYL